MTTKQQYIDDFEQATSNLSWWQNTAGTQFNDGLALFFGLALERAEMLAARHLGEANLSTAINRASILAKAADRGYVPRPRQPAHGFITIKNGTENAVAVPVGTRLLSKSNDEYRTKTLISSVPAGASVDVEIEQLKTHVEADHVVNLSTENQVHYEVYLSPEISAKAHDLTVYVTPVNGTKQLWQHKYRFRNTLASDQVYDKIYSVDDRIGVRFGNGRDWQDGKGLVGNGLALDNGDTVSIEVDLTEGAIEVLADETLTVIDEDGSLSGLEFKTKTVIAGGAEQESLAEIKRAALYAELSDFQPVWDDDYKFYINQRIANLVHIKVWGEDEAEKQDGASLNNINTVFISCWSRTDTQAYLKERIESMFAELKLVNRRVRYVDAVERSYTLTLTGRVNPKYDLNQARSAVKQALNTRFGAYAATTNNFEPARVRLRDIWSFLDTLEYLNDYEVVVDGLGADLRLEEFAFLNVDSSDFTGLVY